MTELHASDVPKTYEQLTAGKLRPGCLIPSFAIEQQGAEDSKLSASIPAYGTSSKNLFVWRSNF